MPYLFQLAEVGPPRALPVPHTRVLILVLGLHSQTHAPTTSVTTHTLHSGRFGSQTNERAGGTPLFLVPPPPAKPLYPLLCGVHQRSRFFSSLRRNSDHESEQNGYKYNCSSN